jgi:integrase
MPASSSPSSSTSRDARKNAAVTRNVRLAAIKSFFRFLEYRQPAALEQIRRVLAIPFKKTNQRLVPYLLKDELQAVLDAPDQPPLHGIAGTPRPGGVMGL